MGFIEYCISQGYKPFRHNKSGDYEDWNIDFFSSITPDFIDIRLKKGSFKIYICLTDFNGKCIGPKIFYPIPVKNRNQYKFIRYAEQMSNEELLKVLEDYMLTGKLVQE